jgi:hypothetical protein
MTEWKKIHQFPCQPLRQLRLTPCIALPTKTRGIGYWYNGLMAVGGRSQIKMEDRNMDTKEG